MVRRLIVVLVAVSVLPLLLTGGIGYFGERAALRDDAFDVLNALANAQSARVADFEQKVSSGLAQVASDPEYARGLAAVADGDDVRPDQIGGLLAGASASLAGALDVHALAPDGQWVASRSGAMPGWSFADLRATGPTRRLLEPDDLQGLLVLAQQTDLAGVNVGYTVIEWSLAPLHAISADTEGVGRTGETLIGVADGEGVLIAASGRGEGAAALTRVDVNTESVLTGQSMGDVRASSDLTDHRGQTVLAATRRVEPDWVVAVKVDQDEAFAPIQRFGLMVLSIGLLALLGVALTASLATRRIISPLARLREASAAMAAGDLSVRVEDVGDDEVSALARQFNAMADRLGVEQQRLDQAVGQRTHELSQALDELRVRNEELDSYAGVAAHDLKTPVVAIKGLAELVRAGGLPPEDQQLMLDRVIASAERMLGLIDDLLRFARAGREAMDLGEVDLERVIWTQVSHLLAADSIAVEVIDIPPVFGDANLLGQVMANVIGNASKYRHPDRPPAVQIHGSQHGGTVTIHFDDNGIGIPEDARATVLQPFVRGDGAAHTQGNGVGLAICTRILQRHDGGLSITDSPSKGTRVTITLPAAGDDPSTAPQTAAPRSER